MAQAQIFPLIKHLCFDEASALFQEDTTVEANREYYSMNLELKEIKLRL